MQSFTSEDLLQYLYKETSPEKTSAIAAALEIDWRLREKFEILETASKQMKPVMLSPRQQTIDFILNYAEKSVEELIPHA